MHTRAFCLFLLLTAITSPHFVASSASRNHFLKPSSLQRPPQEFIELAHLLPSSDHVTPCTLTLINHSFANTINRSPSSTIPYFPPTGCPQPWSKIILEFDAKCKGRQRSHIAGLWLGGVELLRTSTAEPSKLDSFWKVRKDITRYSSVLVQSKHNVTMMLEKMVDNGFNGVCHVDVTLFFFKDKAVTVPSILSKNNSDSKLRFESDKYYYPPADMIIPISHDHDGDQRGFWFRIEKESDLPFKKIKYPRNAHRVILELYVSFHGNDEFWYSNPPNSYIEKNNLTTGRGNGCYREVFVKIDGKLVASEVPFPVMFPGGINPWLWKPVVAIGAFSLPSYDMDLTPFLGLVLDGKGHKVGFGVKEGISFWLLNANLHIWVDHSSSKVIARSSLYQYPNLHIQVNEAFKYLDGKVDVKAKRRTEFVGWVKSSLGNLTTRVARQFRFRDSLKFDKNGSHKLVQHRVKVKRQVEVRDELGHFVTRVLVRRWYPLDVRTLSSSSSGSEKNRFVIETNVSHLIREECSIGNQRSSVFNSQVSGGLMEVKDHSMLSGEGNIEQSYSYRDEFVCYTRKVAARNGKLISDDTTSSCVSAF